MAECKFCEIVAGRAHAARVAEDAATVAFMNLHQRNPGHTLIAPKRHATDLFALEAIEAAVVFGMAYRIARALRQAFNPEGLNLWQANGAAAGQTVFHTHLHVVPRFSGDSLIAWYTTGLEPKAADADLDSMAELLRAALET